MHHIASLAQRAPPATHTWARWQPYNSLQSLSARSSCSPSSYPCIICIRHSLYVKMIIGGQNMTILPYPSSLIAKQAVQQIQYTKYSVTITNFPLDSTFLTPFSYAAATPLHCQFASSHTNLNLPDHYVSQGDLREPS